MKKDIILLAKSWKRTGYCVAGIDTTTGEWVRIVSDNVSIQHAVTDDDMAYEDGTSPQILDKVSIDCIGSTLISYQPENYTMDSSQYWKKVARVSLDDVINLHPTDFHGRLFYNYDKKVTANEMSAIRASERYSLALIRPLKLTITVKRWDGDHRAKITASFSYMGGQYRYIKLTDPVFTKPYQDKEDGSYPLENVYFVVSLADPDPRDGNHWKLIATVLEE